MCNIIIVFSYYYKKYLYIMLYLMKNDVFDFIFGIGRFKKLSIILYFLLYYD